MVNVILFGTGKGSLIVESALKDTVHIICYCDNDKSKWETFHNGKIVINPSQLIKTKFDFIVIASQFNESIYNQLKDYGISDNKILQFYVYVDYAVNTIKNKLREISDDLEKYEVIATGLSYTDYALSAGGCIKKLVNFANPSQDLFYDYNIVKFIINNNHKKIINLKYVIIGLCYYSFEYDMSLSAMKYKVPIYYDAIGISRNFPSIENFLKKIKVNINIAKEILKLDSNGFPSVNWYSDVENKIIINEEAGRKQAYLDCKKKYPKTVKENIIILQDYLDLLRENFITPIIIVSPVSKYYSKYFSKELRKKFYCIIKEITNKYNVKFIDFFDAQEFNNEDFYDVSHLNWNGSNKFIKLLNDLIK